MKSQRVTTDSAHRGALLTLVLAAMAGCSGNRAEEVDLGTLIQTGKFEEAAQVAERRLLSVPKGTVEERNLVLDYAAALSFTDGTKARDCFLGFAADHPELVTAKHSLYVVSSLRTFERFSEALDVLVAAKTRWPDNPTLPALIEMLKADIIRSGSPDIYEGLRCYW